MFKMNANVRSLLGVVSTLAAGTAAFFALAYIRSGRGHKSSLIPQPVEEQLERATAFLDAQFGKAVVDRAMDMLQHTLRGTGPDKLVLLLEQIFEPEVLEHAAEPDAQLAK